MNIISPSWNPLSNSPLQPRPSKKSVVVDVVAVVVVVVVDSLLSPSPLPLPPTTVVVVMVEVEVLVEGVVQAETEKLMHSAQTHFAKSKENVKFSEDFANFWTV